MIITLRPVTDADLPLFEKWLSEPHVAKWYHDPADWINEFNARDTEFHFIHHFIAECDGAPFGFCQYYACRDSGEDWNGYEPTSDTYSIDYLIGEKTYLHRGFGKLMVNDLTEKIKMHPDAKRIIVQPEKGNEASRGLLISCGFSHIDDKDLFVRLI